jgi:hypothetical protein
MNREDTQNLTVQNVEMRSEGVTVGAGTDPTNPVPHSLSLQPSSLSDSTNAIVNDAVISSTISSNLMNADNTVPLNTDEINVCDQTLFNMKAQKSVTEDTDNSVRNVNINVNNALEIAPYLDVSGQQSECDTLSTVGNVILVAADEKCSKDMCNVRELSLQIDTKDGLRGEEMNPNFKMRMNAIHGTDATTDKEGNEINCTSEKCDEDNDSKEPRLPICDILQCCSHIHEYSRNDSHEVESGNICDSGLPAFPVMVHQASQTVLEERVEDYGGVRFLSVAQKPVVTTPAVVSKPSPVISAVSKIVATGKSPSVASARTGVRTSLAPSVRPQPSVRPACAAVSKLTNPANTRSQTLSHTSPTATKPYSSPQLIRSRTSTDVRPTGRGTALKKLPAAATILKSQRPTLVSRQVRNSNCLNLHVE